MPCGHRPESVRPSGQCGQKTTVETVACCGGINHPVSRGESMCGDPRLQRQRTKGATLERTFARAKLAQTPKHRRRIGIAEKSHFVINRGQRNICQSPSLRDDLPCCRAIGPKPGAVVGIESHAPPRLAQSRKPRE